MSEWAKHLHSPSSPDFFSNAPTTASASAHAAVDEEGSHIFFMDDFVFGEVQSSEISPRLKHFEAQYVHTQSSLCSKVEYTTTKSLYADKYL